MFYLIWTIYAESVHSLWLVKNLFGVDYPLLVRKWEKSALNCANKWDSSQIIEGAQGVRKQKTWHYG